MRANPVGNQIRSLQTQLDSVKKDFELLLTCLEAKSPELFAEYGRVKEEVVERANLANRASQAQQAAPTRFVATEKVRKSRF